MSEAPATTVQPGKSFARILRRGAVLHSHEFFDDAHSLLSSLVIEPGFSRLRNRMAIIRRIASRGMVLQLALDIRKHAAGAKPEQLRFKPGIAKLLFHQSKPVKRLLRRADAARWL